MKHIVLVRVLRHLVQIQSPLCYVDSHAGAAGHVLHPFRDRCDQPYTNGISRLWVRNDLPEGIDGYLDLVRGYNGSGDLARYPGSAWLASRLLRSIDRLHLFDTQADVIEQLHTQFAEQKNVAINRTDGYAACISLLPPAEPRGLVLIDPPYFRTSDYQSAPATLLASQRLFPAGTCMLWYPVVDRLRVDALANAVRAGSTQESYLYELRVRQDSDDGAMTGCGIVMSNPPPGLNQELPGILSSLAGVLGNAGRGSYRIARLNRD